VGARRRLLLRIRRRTLLSDFVKRKHFVPEFVETAAEIVIFGLYLKLRIRNVNLFFLSRTKIDPLAAAFGNWAFHNSSSGAFPKCMMHDTEDLSQLRSRFSLHFWHLQCWAADDSNLTSYGTMASNAFFDIVPRQKNEQHV